MDILVASHGFPPAHAAGAERRAERMARWLNANGHQVTVFTIEQVDSPQVRLEAREQDGFLVYRLSYDMATGDPFQNLYDNPVVGDALRFVCATRYFDLVHMISGYLLGVTAIETVKQMGLPLAITLTEYWFMCARLNLIQVTGVLCNGPESVHKCTRCLLEDKRRYRLPTQSTPAIMELFWPMSQRLGLNSATQEAIVLRQRRLKTALESADLVICPSAFLIGKFQEFHYNIDYFVHLRQGLVTQASRQKSQTQDALGETLRLGYLGQIKYHKGVDILVDAVIALLDRGDNLSLDLWGNETEEADYVSKLKARSQSYPAIRWNGQFTGNRVWDVLGHLDAVVVPSRWYENSPNVILEAFSMGIPVVTSALGGMAELVSHEENGLLFQLDDVDDLLKNLRRLLHEPGLLQRLRERIPSIKTLDQEMHEIMGHYERLLKSVY